MVSGCVEVRCDESGCGCGVLCTERVWLRCGVVQCVVRCGVMRGVVVVVFVVNVVRGVVVL